jgi:hypothetical protein
MTAPCSFLSCLRRDARPARETQLNRATSRLSGRRPVATHAGLRHPANYCLVKTESIVGGGIPQTGPGRHEEGVSQPPPPNETTWNGGDLTAETAGHYSPPNVGSVTDAWNARSLLSPVAASAGQCHCYGAIVAWEGEQPRGHPLDSRACLPEGTTDGDDSYTVFSALIGK